MLLSIIVVAPLAIVWDAKTKLLFVHVPKAAGSSVEMAMDKYMLIRDGKDYHTRTREERKVLCSACEKYGSATPQCSKALGMTKVIYSVYPQSEHNTEYVAQNTLRRCRNYTSGVRSFALVRNPLERLISGYNWAVNTVGETNHGTFMDYMSRKHFHLFKRPQVEYVSPCTTIFAYEDLDAVWDFMQDVYPGMKRGAKVNTKKSDQKKVTPHPSVVEQIMTEYRDDWDLWLTAVARSTTKGWWRNAPCVTASSKGTAGLNATGISAAVEEAWRSLARR